MGTIRKIHRLRGGDIIVGEEHHDGRYGAPGEKRAKKKKPTKEQMDAVNAANKAKKVKYFLLEYFNAGDYFVTWTYAVKKRPADLGWALKDFEKAIRKVRDKYRKKKYELFWIRNIEQGTKGAWHIHLVINKIEGAADIIESAWDCGGTYITAIKKSKFYDEDFSRLAAYITKDERTREARSDGKLAKPRLKQASYGRSRNMSLPKPHVDKLKRWKKEIKPKKGYYIARIHEGINPVTGYRYRSYTMIRLNRRI